MNDIFFSVVVPCYNVEKSILPTLDSLRAQSFKSFEVILVNDGSVDNTLQILESYVLPVSKRVINQQNAGTAAARNAGMKVARGSYIALLDGDDYWAPEKLAVVYEYVKQKDIELLCHNEYMVNGKNEITRHNYYGPYSSFEDFLFKGNCVSPSATVIRKNVFEKSGLFNEDRKLIGVEDYDMWLRMAQASIQFTYVKDFLGSYVIHGSNISKTFKYFKTEERIIVLYAVGLKKNFKNYWLLRKRFLIFYLIKLKAALSQGLYSYIPVFMKDSALLFFSGDFFQKRFKKLDA